MAPIASSASDYTSRDRVIVYNQMLQHIILCSDQLTNEAVNKYPDLPSTSALF